MRLFPREGKAWKLLLSGALTGLCSMMIMVCCYPVGYVRRYLEPSPPDPASPFPPVLLIHGLYHNPSAWALFKYWLKRAGFTNLYTFGYSSWNCTFFDILERLEAKVEQVSSLHQGKPVILLGHSLGGLLARACAERVEDGRRIAAVVTLGSPHQGSKLAALGLGRLARSLLYRGALIEELERRRMPCDIPRAAIFSPIDNMVFPWDALRVPFPDWEHIESSPVSHVWLLYHKRTAQLAISFLKGIEKKRMKDEGKRMKDEG